MKGQSSLRFAILGLGRHASRVMLPVFRECERASLVAVAGSKEKKTLIGAGQTVRFYSDYYELLQQPDIDAIYIALPNHLHAEWSIKALEAGKHVICEKPIAVNYSEAHRIQSAASANQLQAREAFMYRFHPQHASVQTLLKEAYIGKVRLMEAHFHYHVEDPSDIRLKPECGGGGLLDVGCYLIDCARFILQTFPEAVSASWVIGPTGVDESAAIQLLFPDGTAAHLTCGCNLARANFYTIYGTRGTIKVANAFHIPRGKKAVINIEVNNHPKKQIILSPFNHYRAEIEHFCQLVQDKSAANSLLGDGLDNMRILDAVRLSAQSKRMIKFDSF